VFEWLILSLIFLVVWVVIFAVKQPQRGMMLLVSAVTSFMGFLEPVFIPAYWNSPSLFDLASKTRFDIESFIFLFAIGGIASILCEAILNRELEKVNDDEVHDRRKSSFSFASVNTYPFLAASKFHKIEPDILYFSCLVHRKHSRYFLQPRLDKKHMGWRLVVRRLVFRVLLSNHVSVSAFR